MQEQNNVESKEVSHAISLKFKEIK